MSDISQKADATSAPPEQTASPTSRTLSQKWRLILPALFVVYPVGLYLLIRRPGDSRYRKTVVALLSAPVFALVVLVALRPYWAFDGGMSFSLDFGEGGAQSYVVARHREQDRGRTRAAHNPEFDGLWYPAYRGPDRDGVIPGNFIALDWDKDPPRERWRQPVGEGWSAFAIGYGAAYTLEQYFDNEVITCYDIATGDILWGLEYPAHFTEDLGGDGPRSTPTLHNGRVYALGAEGHLTCADAKTGEQKWRHQINRDFGADNLMWAMSASPYIFGETVIVTNSGVGGGSVVAYRLDDGRLAWSSDVGQQSYSSPVVASVAGRELLLNLAAFNLNALNPRDGKLLWSFPFGTDIGITGSQPVVIGDDQIFISAGYGLGSKLLEVERDAEGQQTPRERWSSVRMKNKFTCSVYQDGYLYGLDERVLACLDAKTGERKWKGGRYNYGSLLLVQGHLLVMGEEGELALVEATPEAFREVGRIQILHDKTWNNPALVDGLLFARNHREMVCYDLRPTPR
ncbi:MAG TPA: PQQ-like beta-propeller repeat protein [Phycisphaerae bacterium]|nr:PQQ-like beta-propeller repeat protein [Phycisphaerae bacterium]HRW52561.1 PQQ-like beta-propeller repeat protein [Phycisphaerae bacterium]